MSLSWAAAQGGLALGDLLTISFQRYLLGGRDHFDAAPASLGALQPCADPDGFFLVPVHAGEAIWIGIIASASWPKVRGVVRYHGRSRDLADGRPAALDAARFIPATPLAVVPGIPRDEGGFLPFMPARGSGSRAGLRFEFEAIGADGLAIAGVARTQLIDPAGFAARTGCPAPPPAAAENGYQGWRLP